MGWGEVIRFDDPNLAANAGLLLVATLTERLGLEALVNATVRLFGRVGGFRPGRKGLTLVHAMIAGGTHIDHADILRAGSTAGVLGHRVMAPLDAGHLLAVVHVRSCPPTRSRRRQDHRAGVGVGCRSGVKPLTIDIDSTICQVEGAQKHVPATATPRSSVTTRCWPHALTTVRSSTPECARDRLLRPSSFGWCAAGLAASVCAVGPGDLYPA